MRTDKFPMIFSGTCVMAALTVLGALPEDVLTPASAQRPRTQVATKPAAKALTNAAPGISEHRLSDRQFAESLMTAATFTQDGVGSIPYRLYVPKDLPPDQKVPLVLFLHGAGERGTNNVDQLLHGVPVILRYARSHGEAVILAPQCPDGPFGKGWVDCDWRAASNALSAEPSVPLRLATALLRKELAELPMVDPSRVYVTGISMGGFGTWDLLSRHPDLFAAAIPICGGADLAMAPKMKDVPIWTFHGGVDSCVPVVRSRNMTAALKACGGKVRYREYPGVDHDCWTRTYQDPEVLTWLFSQRNYRIPQKTM